MSTVRMLGHLGEMLLRLGIHLKVCITYGTVGDMVAKWLAGLWVE